MSGPFIKWPGGKRRLAPAILSHVSSEWLRNPVARYVEPFIGGGAVFFALRDAGFAGAAVLNDLNARLVETYRDVRDRPDHLAAEYRERLGEYERADDDGRASLFAAWRSRFNTLPPEHADVPALMLALNATCFNGLYRENASGGFNAPRGKSSSGKAPPVDGKDDVIAAASAALSVALLRHGSAFDVLTDIVAQKDASDTVVYLDPPYPTDFDTYVAGGFGRDAQRELATLAAEVAARGAQVIISNSDCGLIRDIYTPDRWALHELTVTHAINRDATGRKGKRELVIVSRPTAATARAA